MKSWELIPSPCRLDQSRFQLKADCSEDDLEDLTESLPVEMGQPYLLGKEDSYRVAVYLYRLGEGALQLLEKALFTWAPGKLQKVPIPSLDLNDPNAREEPVPPPGSLSSASKSKKKSGRGGEKHKSMGKGKISQSGGVDLSNELTSLNPRYIFEQFVVGPQSRFTHAAAQAVAENPGKIYNPLFIYSSVGLGKTHLLHAIGNKILAENKSAQVLYLTAEEYITEVIDAIRRGTLSTFRERYKVLDVLLMDDIQFMAESESTQEEFFHVFNALHQAGKQIVLSSDRPPKYLVTLEDRLRSRFEWGLTADIKIPNLETRVAILKRKGEEEEFLLSNEILFFIAGKLKSNVRELEGFLTRINAYATLTHQEINMDLVRQIMRELLPGEEEIPASENVTSINVTSSSGNLSLTPIPLPPAVRPARPRKVISEPVLNSDLPKIPAEMSTLHKPVEVAFFYPEGQEKVFSHVKEKFSGVIRKHRLKFRLEGKVEKAYLFSSEINEKIFIETCQSKKLSIAIVLGPPSDLEMEEGYSTRLSEKLAAHKIVLQFIPWVEREKDYRYLNLSLDITLLKQKDAIG